MSKDVGVPRSSGQDVSQRAVHAAAKVASELGLRFTRCVVLWERSNLLVHLSPAPVVARIATRTRTVRQGDDWLKREVAVAGYLAEVGAPVVAPSIEVPPGPHHEDGFAMTFWEFVQEAREPLDAREAGRRLRICHEALADFNGALPTMAPLVEAENIVERFASDKSLERKDVELLRASAVAVCEGIGQFELPVQALHGDAGLSNVLQTVRGPLWNDWEDTFLGPRVWDLACLEAAAPPFGQRDENLIAEARAGYGTTLSGDMVDAFLAARRFQVSVWGVAIGLASDDPDAVQRRLDWFRQ